MEVEVYQSFSGEPRGPVYPKMAPGVFDLVCAPIYQTFNICGLNIHV